MKSNIIKAMLAGLIALPAAPGILAQNAVPASQLGAFVYGTRNVKLDNYQAVDLTIPIKQFINLAVTDADWVKATVSGEVLTLSIDQNNSVATRTADVILRSTNGTAKSTMTVTQPGWQFVNDAQALANDMYVVPVYASDACSNSRGRANSSDEGIDKTYDGNSSTIYHSSYWGFSNTSAQWPVLEYYFAAQNAAADQTVDLESVTYVPRQDGNSNGNFGEVAIEVGKMGSDRKMTWTNIRPDGGCFDFGFSGNTTTIAIPESLQAGLRAVRFVVHTGSSDSRENFASCSEVKFRKKVSAPADMEVFADDICSAIKPGVDAARIAAMENPFYRQLAELIFNGDYDPSNMVSTHSAVMSPQTLAEQWNAPGKCYDQSQGVTGVALVPGKYVVMVSGISEKKGSLDMVVVRWHGHEQYKDASGNTQSYIHERFNFQLFNGLNVITIPEPKRESAQIVEGHDMGLAYINNFDDEVTNPEMGAERAVSVHIIGGLYNGCLSNLNTNAENDEILKHAVYPCIDLLGQRVHSVWQTKALKQYTAGQYVKYINLLDLLIIWEHRVLGLEKYDRIPDNRSMTYVNYNYYMYQGGWGPTFMYDTQSRVCNPDNLLNNDSDAVWGLSHEWGHQHQMAPYYRWIGTAEVSNNIFSAYNVLHMGYDITKSGCRYPASYWHRTVSRYGVEKASRIENMFLNDDWDRNIESVDKNTDYLNLNSRTAAATSAKAGNAFGWCDELKQFAIDQVKYPTKRFSSDKVYSDVPTDTWNTANTQNPLNIVDPRRALNPIEAYTSQNGELILGPHIYLMCYFAEQLGGCSDADARPDLFADLFESMRQNDFPEGSSVEPGKTKADKYEILTSIHNNNKSTDPSVNKVAQFKERYPESCWVKKGYIGTDNNGLDWTANSAPAILNCVMKFSRLTGYNLWSYFDQFGTFSVCALEADDYGKQYYVMTDDMYDEFKADMDALEAQGVLKPLSDKMRKAISIIDAPKFAQPDIPNDRPITGQDF